MSYIMTFTSLQADAQAYLARGGVNDPTVFNQIPRLIMMAEQNIATELKPQGFERYVVSRFVIGAAGAVILKPDRWRETFFWNFGTGTNNVVRNIIYPRTMSYLRDAYPDPTDYPAASVIAAPYFYADYGFNNWLVAPSPNGTYPFEVGYYERLQPLDDANQQNWLTQYAPHLLLYRVLLEATPFLKNTELVGQWKGFYDSAVGALANLDVRKLTDKSQKATG